jgi:hypothetical protein
MVSDRTLIIGSATRLQLNAIMIVIAASGYRSAVLSLQNTLNPSNLCKNQCIPALL